MRLENRLFEMSQRGECFRVGVGGGSRTLVPFGKYAGLWWYSTNRLSYSAEVEDDRTYSYTTMSNKHKRIRLPMPNWMYNAPEKFYKEHLDKRTATMYKIWKDFEYQYLEPVIREATQYCNELQMSTGFEAMMALVLGLAPVQLRQVMYAFPERVKFIVEWFQNSGVLRRIGVAKRQRFVIIALEQGSKEALRKCFPRTHRRVINDVLNGPSYVFDPKVLSTFRARADYAACQAGYELSLEYREVKPVMIKLAEKHGLKGLEEYQMYRFEVQRAVHAGIRVRRPLATVETPATYRRWHDELSELVMQAAEAKRNMKVVEVEAIHAKNWAGLPLYDGVMTPLILRSEFQRESSEMGHCIRTYFQSTSWMFAHIEYQGERASVQFNCDTLNQLYGHSNQAVSDGLRAFVTRYWKDHIYLTEKEQLSQAAFLPPARGRFVVEDACVQ